MEIFIDSADIDEIKETFSWGIVSGITTNPGLIEKAAKKHKVEDFGVYLDEVLKLVKEQTPEGSEGSVSLEILAQPREGESLDECMFREGMRLWERFNPIAENVYVKIPINPWMSEGDDKYAGIKAVTRLYAKDVKTNVTLVHSPAQALLAAEAGAAYVSPFLGGLDDSIAKGWGSEKEKFDYWPKEGRSYEQRQLVDPISQMRSGVQLVEEISKIYGEQGYETIILAASLRNPVQVAESAAAGAQLATIPFSVLEQMLDHPLTVGRMDSFTKAADETPEYKKLFEATE